MARLSSKTDTQNHKTNFSSEGDKSSISDESTNYKTDILKTHFLPRVTFDDENRHVVEDNDKTDVFQIRYEGKLNVALIRSPELYPLFYIVPKIQPTISLANILQTYKILQTCIC